MPPDWYVLPWPAVLCDADVGRAPSAFEAGVALVWDRPAVAELPLDEVAAVVWLWPDLVVGATSSVPRASLILEPAPTPYYPVADGALR